MGKLFLLSGPSCMGKTLVIKMLQRHHADLFDNYRKLVLYNDRARRPSEKDGVDYHFRSTERLKELGEKDGFVLVPVRADLQAVRLQEVRDMLEAGDVFFEGNPGIVGALADAGILDEVDSLEVFLAPLSRAEIETLRAMDPPVDLPELVADVMRRKLLRRTQRQNGLLSAPDLEDIEVRAGAAYGEMCEAWRFDWVVPNHDGEDSENWDAFPYPIGDAWRTLTSVATLLRGEEADGAEQWDEAFLKPVDD